MGNENIIKYCDLSIAVPKGCQEEIQVALERYEEGALYQEVQPKLKKGLLSINSVDLITLLGYVDPDKIQEFEMARFKKNIHTALDQQLTNSLSFDTQGHYKWCLAALKNLSAGRHLSLLLVSILILFPVNSFSQVVNCNGTWTNQKCDGSVGETSFEETQGSDAPIDPGMKQKKSIVQDFVTAVYAAKNQHEIEYPLKSIEAICYDPETSVSECGKIVTEAQAKLAELVQQARLSKPAEVISTPIVSNETNKSTVVIISENDRNRHHKPDHRPRPIEPRKSGPFTGYQSRFK